MRANGETNPISILLVVALIAAGFYAFHVAPLYYDNLEVREAATQAINIYMSEGNMAKARGSLDRRLNMTDLGWHYGVNDDDEEVIKPGLNVQEEDMTIEEDDRTGDLTCQVRYTRTIQFSPLEKRKTYPFQVTVKVKRKK